jgi:aspartyl-tRNA(Asn)/glutamyl-tRNA(Gln) amidotransferase subunit C
MAHLTEAEVRHIAKLARLRLSDEEVVKFTKELGSILAYVETMQKVDTKNVEPTAQVTGLSSVFRDDALRPPLADSKELVHCSPLPIVDNQIQTLSAHG